MTTTLKKTILVVGGCGYIGSHMVRFLLDSGFNVVVLDNLSTGYVDALVGGELIVGDCGDSVLLKQIFAEHQFDGVMHFASYIQVGESVNSPDMYYQNNTAKTLTLIEEMRRCGVNNFIFSSTAAVFGEPKYIPIDERHPLDPINPYGKSKFMVELMLADMEKAYDFRSVALRYFNAAGADPKGDIGERHNPETHLIPLALRASLEENEDVLQVFGGDYSTPDGTCIRDYIHVIDLCAAHLLALQYLWGDGKSDAFNLGNGTGFSIYQVLAAVKTITGVAVPYRLGSRRPGDPERLVADSTKAAKILGWRPQFPELNTIVKHAWLWEQGRKNKLATNGEVKN